MEVVPDRIDVLDLKCHGCIRQQKEIMISLFQEKDDDPDRSKFTSIFITLEQAKQFQKFLDDSIKETEEYIVDTINRHKNGMSASQIARDTMKPIALIQRVINEFKGE